MLVGSIKNISEGGLMAEFTGTSQQLDEEGHIHMGQCIVQVQRMWSNDQEGKVLAGFRIQYIIEGEQQWRKLLCDTQRPFLSERKAA